jgi:hypothetical protein
MKKFEKICKAVLKLTENDFAEGYNFCDEQESYIHPLKNATAHKTRLIGANNRSIISALSVLQDYIKKGGELAKS